MNYWNNSVDVCVYKAVVLVNDSPATSYSYNKVTEQVQ